MAFHYTFFRTRPRTRIGRFKIGSQDLHVYYKDFIRTFGYELEENPVTTEDGYILSLWHLQPKILMVKLFFFSMALPVQRGPFFI